MSHTPKQFDYVVAYMDSLLATTNCTGINTTAAKCQVKMQLLGTYFTEDDPEDLTISGVVKLAYMDSTGRRLMGRNSRGVNLDMNMKKRNLDGTAAEGAAAFDELKVRLSPLSTPSPTLSPTVKPTVKPTPEPSTAPTSKPTATITDDEEPVSSSPKVDGAESTSSSSRNMISHSFVIFLLTLLVGTV